MRSTAAVFLSIALAVCLFSAESSQQKTQGFPGFPKFPPLPRPLPPITSPTCPACETLKEGFEASQIGLTSLTRAANIALQKIIECNTPTSSDLVTVMARRNVRCPGNYTLIGCRCSSTVLTECYGSYIRTGRCRVRTPPGGTAGIRVIADCVRDTGKIKIKRATSFAVDVKAMISCDTGFRMIDCLLDNRSVDDSIVPVIDGNSCDTSGPCMSPGCRLSAICERI